MSVRAVHRGPLRSRTVRKVAATTAALIAASVGTIAASAPTASAACPTDVYYSVSGTNSYVPFKNIPVYKDGKGGTVSVTRSYSSSASYQVTAGAESEVGAVLAKAKISVSASLTKTNSTSTTHNYSHKISKNKYGHVQYVAWGKTVHWKKYQTTPQCGTRILSTGTIKFPSSSEGWRYWETSS